MRRMGNSHTYKIGISKLEINPTRWINHLYHDSGVNDPPLFARYIQRVMEGRAVDIIEASNYDVATGLDFQDNIIPIEVYRHCDDASTVLIGFIRKTKEFLGEKIREALPTSDVHIEEIWNDWTCKIAEIYWEYSCPNAIALVHDIKHTILPKFSKSKWAHYRLNRDEDYSGPEIGGAIHQNAVSLNLNLGSKSRSLAIYAKQIERVRLEVRYNTNVRRNLDIPAINSFDIGMPLLMRSATIVARKHMSRLLSDMQPHQISTKSKFSSLIDFIKVIRGTGLDERQTDEIISILASNSRIVVQRHTELARACTAMARRGLLTKSNVGRNENGTVRYIVKPAYQKMLIQLLH